MAQKEGGTDQGRIKTEDNLRAKTMAGGPSAGGGVVVEVREKKGPLRAAIPTMPFPVAVICLFLNTFIPGLGTFVSAFTVLCGARSELISERGVCCVFWLNVAAAFIQILTAVIMVGWIMSIFWGMDMVILAKHVPGTPTKGGVHGASGKDVTAVDFSCCGGAAALL
ncbi:protein stum homolog isoform X1 [Girardinichthys multiradiatus]|uniref:protein stum homolog isoform X1 n=1 Tax=Girardinichthys multiradiatus TaxID=208333 RepID=UPI001FADF6FB|nr:protein stum homolog isoform X1 [Girardinichthys multiradiatus]XP_047244577.1 protein stum homolog isoform X1 [Girardinichthys multiradiatus]